MRFSRYASVLAERPNDCGAACIATVAKQHRIELHIEDVSDAVASQGQGTDLRTLCDVANDLGFSASCGMPRSGAIDGLPLPAIAHLHAPPHGHFVVIHAVASDVVVIADPANGIMRIARGEFDQRWSGYILLLTPLKTHFPIRRRHPLVRVLLLCCNERVSFGWSALLYIVTALLGYSIPLFFQEAVDRLIPHGEQSLLVPITCGLAAALMLREAFTFIRQLSLARAGRRIELNLGTDFVAGALAAPLSSAATDLPGEIGSKLTDVGSVRAAIIGPLFLLVTDAISVLLSAGLLFWYSPPLLAVASSFFVVIGSAMFWFTHKIGPIDRRARHKSARVYGAVVDALENIWLIKAFAVERRILSDVNALYTESLNTILYRNVLSYRATWLTTFLGGMADVAILLFGVHCVILHTLTLGHFVFVYAILSTFIGPAHSMAPKISSVIAGVVGMERIERTLDLANTDGCPTSPCLPPEWKCIGMREVAFWYRKGAPVLSDVTLDIYSGELLVIFGSTGSGKSTLACILSGLLAPKEGTLCIDGRPLPASDRRSLSSLVGIVFQDARMVAGTIEDNIKFGNIHASMDRIMNALSIVDGGDLVRSVPRGIEHCICGNDARLSSGQRQKIALARGIICDFPVLILDETTSNLDIATEDLVLNRIKEYRKGKATIVITHRVSSARFADRIVVMKNGRIAEVGTHEQLYQYGRHYRALWDQHTESAAPHTLQSG